MRHICLLLLLSSLVCNAQAEQERVGDWQFDTRSVNGSYSASSSSASGLFGDSRLVLSASPQKQGPCQVQLGYSLFGPYAISLKGRSLLARVDRDSLRQVKFSSEQSGRTRDGVKFTTGFIDLDDRAAQELVVEMLEGKWLRLRLDEKSPIDRFPLYGFSRAARATLYFCKTPNAKDRYPLDVLLKKQDDADYF
ncbi:MAG: hypothetical protein HQL47_11925 [Gammaproteobacteria bacterium]|nr:hypothetical protein [Gammaproteobacteria bacterium]